MPTYVPPVKPDAAKWHVIDASGKVLGRIATDAAKLLQAPVSYFFEGLDETDGGVDDGFAQRMTEFVSTPEGLELASLFPRLADRRLRRRVVDLVRAMVDDDGPENGAA